MPGALGIRENQPGHHPSRDDTSSEAGSIMGNDSEESVRNPRNIPAAHPDEFQILRDKDRRDTDEADRSTGGNQTSGIAEQKNVSAVLWVSRVYLTPPWEEPELSQKRDRTIGTNQAENENRKDS